MRRWISVTVLANRVMVAAGPAALAARAPLAPPALPNSMASAGDSITRAFDVGWCCFLSDSPQYSWSTGTSTTVNSEYQRIVRANANIDAHVFNDANTGAKMADLDGQLAAAAAQKVQYVTILMGANDLCTSSAATMTTTANFTEQYTKALADFFAADAGAHVFVSSIPNIYQLWSRLHTNFWAWATWNAFGICPSMLSSHNSQADRQKVVTQEAADNSVLAAVCTTTPTWAGSCRWDGYATYNVNFPASYISTVDYFHPNTSGQNALAATAWTAGYWPQTP